MNRKQEVPSIKKELNQKAATETAKIPASQYQIDQLEAKRPKLTPAPSLTPQTQNANEARKAEALRKNAEIDKQQADFRERIKKQKGKSKEAFERAQTQERERKM